MNTSKAIVLNSIKYGDTSLIVKMFTDEFGLLSFIVKGVRKKKSPKPQVFFMPLSVLEISFRYSPTKDLQILQNVRPSPPLMLHQNIIKSSLSMFLSEVLVKAIKGTEKDIVLFDFLHSRILFLEENNDGLQYFHLVFCIELSKHLGLFPKGNYSESKKYFHLNEGCFSSLRTSDEHQIEPPYSEAFNELLKVSISEIPSLHIDASTRYELLNKMIAFFQIHIPNFHTLKSMAILHTVFH